MAREFQNMIIAAAQEARLCDECPALQSPLEIAAKYDAAQAIDETKTEEDFVAPLADLPEETRAVLTTVMRGNYDTFLESAYRIRRDGTYLHGRLLKAIRVFATDEADCRGVLTIPIIETDKDGVTRSSSVAICDLKMRFGEKLRAATGEIERTDDPSA